MANQPFSAPPPDSEVKSEVVDEPVKVLPPTSVTVGTTAPTNVLSSTNPHSVNTIVVQGSGNNTVANVFMIIGVIVSTLAIIAGGLGFAIMPEEEYVGELKLAKFQPIVDDYVVFSSNGTTHNESFKFTNEWYEVNLEHGAEINSISILNENNESIFEEERCKDTWDANSEYDDFIDECKDYTSYSIGFIELENSITATININATGNVSIIDLNDEFWDEIFTTNSLIDEEQWAGPLLLSFCMAPCGCCFGSIILLVGIIVRFA